MKPLKCPPRSPSRPRISPRSTGWWSRCAERWEAPRGQAPGRFAASGGEKDATFFVFEDDKENVDPKTGVSARLSSGAGSRRRARLDDPFPRGRFLTQILVFFGCSPNVSRARRTDPYRALPSPQTSLRSRSGFPGTPRGVAEAAVGAPSRQPLADVTAASPRRCVNPARKNINNLRFCRPRLFSFSKRKVRMLGARGKTRARRKTRRIADQTDIQPPQARLSVGKAVIKATNRYVRATPA